jgi:signal peptidase I
VVPEVGPVSDGKSPRRAPRSAQRRVMEWIAVLALAVIAALVIRGYVFQIFSVPTGSMLPTIQLNDRLLVDKFPGFAHSIHLGDLVVFHKVPADTDSPPILVKRVIGLPGQTISSSGDVVYIDGHAIKEPWLAAMDSIPDCAEASFGIPVTHIPAGRYFVMGDCRGDSYDSRFWGTVPQSNMIGRAMVVIWRHNHPWFHWF